MASSYFTIPSFNRAKKNKEDLEKTNPQEPVLKDEDEKFFDKEMRSGSTTEAAKDAPATKITDDGEEKPVTAEEKEEAIASEDQTVISETRPDSGIAQEKEEATANEDKTAISDNKPESGIAQEKEEGAANEDQTEASDDRPDSAVAQKKDEAASGEDQTAAPDDPPESEIEQKDGAPYDEAQKEQAAARKEKKKKGGMDLPSQEEAEASTRGFSAQSPDSAQEGEKTQGEKKTWASYLPSMRSKRPESSGTSDQTPPASAGGEGAEKKDSEGEKNSTDETQQPRTWASYASSIVPSLPTFTSKKSDADSTSTPVYNEDGTINEAATAEKQQQEVSVLLDNLNLSSINNRVFSFSADTQRLYERFLQCLKDVIAGGPTAYEDMDKLMKEAGPKLEEQWKTMPPFVQTLVKSLPLRLGPEIMAAASENPNDEMRKNLQGASMKSSGGGGSGGVGVASAAMREGGSGEGKEAAAGKEGEQKQKRKIPGLKSLTSQQGAIATLLRNTVTFIQTRFPFLASMTNVVMSLAVFILMFVFWYCHKRGKEVRLAREAEGEGTEGIEGEGKPGGDEEMSDSAEGSEVDEMVEELEKADEQQQQGVDGKAKILDQSAPAEVPLPEKGEETESEKREEGIAATT